MKFKLNACRGCGCEAHKIRRIAKTRFCQMQCINCEYVKYEWIHEDQLIDKLIKKGEEI